MAELTDARKSALTTPVRRSVGPVRARHAARQAGRVSGAARRRPPASAVRAELPRQHLRHQAARRRAHPLGERRRQPEGGAASRSTSSCPISSSIGRAGASARSSGDGIVAHVGFAHPICGTLASVAADAARDGRRDGAPRRHLRLHGRAAVLDAGRVASLSLVGRGHHRHDEPAGGQARARGRDLLQRRSRSSPTTTAGTPTTTR